MPQGIDLWTLALVLLGVVGIIVFAYIPIIVARRRMHPHRDAIAMLTFFGLFLPILWIAALVWALTAQRPQTQRGFPVAPRHQHWLIWGVDQASGIDVQRVIAANSAANARIVAELDGIAVRHVEPYYYGTSA